jgi:hypothetical protein
MLSICAESSKADLVFYDGFDSYSFQIPWSGEGNWTATEASVDLIGTGSPWDLLPGNGLYLDMDGSTNNAGTIESIGIALAPGDYSLIFDLAGNQRGDRGGDFDSVIVQVTGFVDETFSDIPYDAPFTTVSIPFTVATATMTKIIFNGLGGDNCGVLIDNVGIDMNILPAPGAVVLGSLGLSFAGWKLRRRKEF